MAATIKWTAWGDKNAKGDVEATGTAGDQLYVIQFDLDKRGRKTPKQTAVVRPGDGCEGPGVVLAESVSGRTAWQKCVNHAKALPAPTTEVAVSA
jgi:hypothetical protein